MPRIIVEVKQVMASFRCYDNSDVIATLIMTIFHLNTTPNACLWRHSLYSNLVLTMKTNCGRLFEFDWKEEGVGVGVY